MKNIYRALTTIGAAVFAVTAVPNARACGEFMPVLNRSMSPATHFALPSTQSMPATLDANGNPTIVGMWYVVSTSEGNAGIPDGTVTDFGIGDWHGDLTEFYNSGGHAPSTQNFCMGTWKQTASGSYYVNHFGYSYDQTSGALLNRVEIKELVTLNSTGNSYTGTFVVTIYDLNGVEVQKPTGDLAGSRLTVDSPIPPVPPVPPGF
jgi:hypothetical protein